MNIAVCDSSVQFMNKFIEEIKKIFPTINVDIFNGYGELADPKISARYDCFFIATEINYQSGVEAALDIHSKNPGAEIVFITENCEKYCQRIFDYADKFKPFAMLNKPVSRMFLRHIIEMLERVLNCHKDKKIDIRLTDKNHITLNAFDIVYIQHNNRISYLYVLDGSCYTSRNGISWFDENLPDFFVHCAKSCIVNMLEIKSVSDSEIKLSDGYSVWCSRQYRKSFIESLPKFCEDARKRPDR